MVSWAYKSQSLINHNKEQVITTVSTRLITMRSQPNYFEVVLLVVDVLAVVVFIVDDILDVNVADLRLLVKELEFGWVVGGWVVWCA